MPELPEVETTLRGIEPHLTKQTIAQIIVRQKQLRWPIPTNLNKLLRNQTILSVERRAKYLLITTTAGTVILHLGMSGRLKITPTMLKANKHDHVDICLENKTCLRFTDPRRFGALLFTEHDPYSHPLLAKLGPEPFAKAFNATYLLERAQRKSLAIKNFLMDGNIVVGVGNIYASEALFLAGINPHKSASDLQLAEFELLVSAVKKVLKKAIAKGGTTLKDFLSANGTPGYFRIELQVYGRDNQPCYQCGTVIIAKRIGQRNTFYCTRCQT